MFCFSAVQRFHIALDCFLSSPTTSECVSPDQKSRSGSSAWFLGGWSSEERGVWTQRRRRRSQVWNAQCERSSFDHNLPADSWEWGRNDEQSYLFSSSTVQLTAATVASMLIIFSSSLLLLLLLFVAPLAGALWVLKRHAKTHSTLGIIIIPN